MSNVFHQNLAKGKPWEDYVGNRLRSFSNEKGYVFKTVKDILGPGKYRFRPGEYQLHEKWKYPDFVVIDNKRMFLVDAKHKKSYNKFLTMDESFIDSYLSVEKYYREEGWEVTSSVFFWDEVTETAYRTDSFVPFDWRIYDNEHCKNGPEKSGMYPINKLHILKSYNNWKSECVQ